VPNDDFSWAFLDGSSAMIGEDRVPATLSVREVADLILPSGEIVACDPLVGPDEPAFERRVASGSYPVILCIARRRNAQDRVACAVLRFSDALVSRYVMATRPDQDIASLKPGYVFAYGVDSGIDCFMAPLAARALIARWDQEDDGDWLIGEMEQAGMYRVGWSNVSLDRQTGANMIAFESGWGDGRFASYWGPDHDGSPVCLLTDFGVVNADES